MESYGELLRKKREEKQVDVATAARETSITREYIEALEKEDSGAFPGDAYVIGFLRNYAEYLGLPSESVLSLYRNKLLQEAPVPVELLAKSRPRFLLPAIIAGVLIVLAGVFVPLYFFVFRARGDARGEVVLKDGAIPNSYELGDRTFARRVYRGDQISVPASNGLVVVTVTNTISAFGMETPVGVVYTDLAEEREIDIDGDAVADLIVYVSDISDTDSAKGAEIRMLVKRGEDGQTLQETDMSAIETFIAGNQKHEPKVILEDTHAYPFTITATFRVPSVLRYRSDNSASEEYFLTSGEIVSVSSRNACRLWMSNSNAISFSVVADTHRIDLGVGRAGQVLAEDVRWIRTAEGVYQLVVIELD